jgi:hypothetical protein
MGHKMEKSVWDERGQVSGDDRDPVNSCDPGWGPRVFGVCVINPIRRDG